MGKIIAFSGSNSKASINQQLVESVSTMIEKNEVEVINLRDFPADIYGIDQERESGFPQSIQALNEKFDQADGFIISSPEHNGSMPAVLKNTIDWLSRMNPKVFREKPTVFMSTSPGARGGKSALNHLLDIMPYRGAKIVGHYSLSSFGDNMIDGVLKETHREEIQKVIAKLEEAI